jgi:FixJ family two-component response regulator
MSGKHLISIVDDDPSVREGLSDLLHSMGFHTRTFESPTDFLTSDELAETSCLITDGRMPEMTGFELHDRLVAAGKKIPTILITAFPNDADRVRALGAGMFCYLPKPFNDNALLSCLRSAVEPRGQGETQ